MCHAVTDRLGAEFSAICPEEPVIGVRPITANSPDPRRSVRPTAVCHQYSDVEDLAIEAADIKDMVLAPEKRHMSLREPAVHAQRIGKRFASEAAEATRPGQDCPNRRVPRAEPCVFLRQTRRHRLARTML